MISIVGCAIIICLRDPKGDEEFTVPVYIAILSSFLIPLSFIGGGMLSRKVLVEKLADANDYTQAYCFLTFGSSEIAAIIYFKLNPGTFNMDLWVKGFIGSMLNVLGCTFLNLALKYGENYGPMFALNMTQTVIVFLIYSYMEGLPLGEVQSIAFVFGYTGGLILVVPNFVKKIWYGLTCRCSDEFDLE